MTFLMGMAKLPDEWQANLQKMMEALMPLYGLSDEVAAESGWKQ